MSLNSEQLQTSSTVACLSGSAYVISRVNATEEHNATAAVGEEGALALFLAAEELEKSGKPEALDTYSKALEAMVSVKGELHVDCVLFYDRYAKALLESSKLSGSVFALIEQQKGKEIKQAPVEAPVAASPTVTENAAATKDTSSDVNMEEEKSEVPCYKVATENSPSEEKCEEKAGDKDMVGLRQLAWELFETARVILEKQEPRDNLRLAGIHQNLGEVAMEDGNFDRAYKELLEAIIILGKVVTESDERLAGAHQVAGLCSLCNQQIEAAGFHYTAAAEGFNFKLTNILVQNAVLERPNVDAPEIQFVKKDDLEKLKAKLGEEHADYVKAAELNAKINNLIGRVIDINYQEEEAAENPDIHSVVKDIAAKLAVKYAEAAQKGAAAVFDTASKSSPVNELVPTRNEKKRPCPVSATEGGQPPSKKAKCDSVESDAAVNETPAETAA